MIIKGSILKMVFLIPEIAFSRASNVFCSYLVEKSGWKVNQVRRAVKKLKKVGMVRTRTETIDGRKQEKFFGKSYFKYLDKHPCFGPLLP